MAELPKVKYSGRIREVKIGKPGTEVVVGGETGYSFYSFEGKTPNAPKLALQVLTSNPKSGPMMPEHRLRMCWAIPWRGQRSALKNTRRT